MDTWVGICGRAQRVVPLPDPTVAQYLIFIRQRPMERGLNRPRLHKNTLCGAGKTAVPGSTATDGQMAAALAPLLPGHATCPEVWAVLSPAAHGAACNNSEEFPKPGGGLISGCFSPPPTFEADSFVAGGHSDVVGSRGICCPVSFASYGRGAGGGRSVSAKQERMSTGALATFSCHGRCTCGNKVLREACRNSFLLAASAAPHINFSCICSSHSAPHAYNCSIGRRPLLPPHGRGSTDTSHRVRNHALHRHSKLDRIVCKFGPLAHSPTSLAPQEDGAPCGSGRAGRIAEVGKGFRAKVAYLQS